MKAINLLLAVIAISFSLVLKAQSIPTINLYAENLPPNNYLNEQGQITGEATKKVKAIMEHAGLDYNIQVYPWARAYKLARDNAYAGVFSMMRSKQREPYFRWICPIAEQESLYFIRLASRTDIILNEINDAKNYMTSVSQDEFDHQLLLQHGFEPRKHFGQTTGDSTNLRLLLSGHTDLIIAAPTTIAQAMKNKPADTPEVIMELSLNTSRDNPLCLAFGLRTPQEVVDKLQQSLDELNTKQGH